MFGFFKKRFHGVTILETAITLPIVLSVVLFSLELIRIGLAQTAVDTITKECTFQLMATGKVEKFDEIFNKYRPLGIPLGNFRYYIRIYSNINTMMSESPYGGETIGWADTEQNTSSPTDKAKANSYGLANTHALLNNYQTNICNGSFGECGDANRKKWIEQSTGVPSGYVFVLTVAVKFPFSSSFIAKLFNGGSNTNQGIYILWARGSGMVN